MNNNRLYIILLIKASCCAVIRRLSRLLSYSGVAWVFVARGADCQWRPLKFADDLFFASTLQCLILDVLPDVSLMILSMYLYVDIYIWYISTSKQHINNTKTPLGGARGDVKMRTTPVRTARYKKPWSGGLVELWNHRMVKWWFDWVMSHRMV